MDKIAELLKGVGASDELAGQICEELKRYDKQVHQKYETAYQKKMEKARELCMEEVNGSKLQLANKVSLFLESKRNEIETRLEQLNSLEETDAMSKLRSMKQLMEGIEVADDSELKALKAQLEDLNKKNRSLLEEKKAAEIAANRANEMALSILRESKKSSLPKEFLEQQEKMKEKAAKKDEDEGDEAKVDLECTTGAVAASTSEPVEEDKKPETIGESIKVQKTPSKTTRRTLVESQTPKKKKVILGGSNDILAIAQSID